MGGPRSAEHREKGFRPDPRWRAASVLPRLPHATLAGPVKPAKHVRVPRSGFGAGWPMTRSWQRMFLRARRRRCARVGRRARSRVLIGASVTVALGTGLGLWASAGGSSTAGSTPRTAASAGHAAAAPTVTILYGTAPDYLDPQESYTAQGDEALWVSYLGLYTYAHKNGAAGGAVIPALATGAPKITDGGKTYTMTLRKGLRYSNGRTVRASDFRYSIERALKLNWGGASFYTGTSSAQPPTRRAVRRRSQVSRRTMPSGRSRSISCPPMERLRMSSPSPPRASCPPAHPWSTSATHRLRASDRT